MSYRVGQCRFCGAPSMILRTRLVDRGNVREDVECTFHACAHDVAMLPPSLPTRLRSRWWAEVQRDYGDRAYVVGAM